MDAFPGAICGIFKDFGRKLALGSEVDPKLLYFLS